ncbi:MAG: S-methyl-5-thioribose-1-phosphate isomerase [Thioalkalivibrionaceae bacterium]
MTTLLHAGDDGKQAPFDRVRPIRFDDDGLHLLDQRLLPAEVIWNTYTDAEAVAQAIREMVVRGAPAIGISAAYGMVLAARAAAALPAAEAARGLSRADEVLRASRPTAVNLFWALDQVSDELDRTASLAGHDRVDALTRFVDRMAEQDIADNRRMGAYGAVLIPEGKAVLTHCNTGSLATAGFGTALGVIRAAFAMGRVRHVFANETRPWLQGSRLTAWELVQDGIPVQLLSEGAAASLLRSGKVGAVIVGADRIAANGDTANKIGTYMLALAARAHGVRFLVAAPVSTIDLDTPDGDAIPIEQRPAAEVLELAGRRLAAAGADAWNPAFDVTPAHLIDALVTEIGVVEQPRRASIRALINGANGENRGNPVLG